MNEREMKVFFQYHRKLEEMKTIEKNYQKEKLNLKFLEHGIDNETFEIMYADYEEHGVWCTMMTEAFEEFLWYKRNFKCGMPIEVYENGLAEWKKKYAST